MLFLPESPRWLVHKGRTLDAYKVWKRIRGIDTPDARDEFFVLTGSVRQEENEVNEGAENKRFPWLDFLTCVSTILSKPLPSPLTTLYSVPRARRSLIYANIMIMLGQLTGINAIMYFMSVLMSQIGFNDENANYMSLVGGGSLLLGTIPAIFLMESFGRRFWAIITLPGFFIGLVLIGISYRFDVETDLMTVEGLYLTGLILYQSFFGSYACLTWGTPANLPPSAIRDTNRE